MIGQYLSNTNESATVSILQNFLELNKAQFKNVLVLERHYISVNELGLFSSEFFFDFGTVAFLFLFDKYYPIMD